MMKEWGAARQRVAEMKVVDPKGGNRFEQEVTSVSHYWANEEQGLNYRKFARPKCRVWCIIVCDIVTSCNLRSITMP